MATSDLELVVRRRRMAEYRGTRYELNALTLRDWDQIRSEALASYRRAMIAAVVKAVEALPEEMRRERIEDVYRRAMAVEHKDLPDQEVSVPLHDEAGRPQMRNGKPVVRRQKSEYALWWMSDTTEGQIFAVWLSLRKSPAQAHVTLDDAAELFSGAIEELVAMANQVGDLSFPSSGNE